MHLESDAEIPLQVERIERFSLFWGEEKLDLVASGQDGKPPVAKITPKAAGGHLIAMNRRPSVIKLEADKFTAYLKEEGLDAIVSRREALGETKREGRERYTRYLKSLIQVGDQHDETYRRVVGHRLEIIPLVDPSSRKPGESLSVRVMFEDKPLVGAKVFALTRVDKTLHSQSSTTNSDGQATFRLDRSGNWLIRLVHMQRAPDGGDVEWESFWGAYMFGI